MCLPSASLPPEEHYGQQQCLLLQNLAGAGLPAAGKLRKEIFPSYARSDNFQAGQQWARMPDAARTSEMTKSPSPASAHPAQPQERMAARWKDGASAQAFRTAASQDLWLA